MMKGPPPGKNRHQFQAIFLLPCSATAQHSDASLLCHELCFVSVRKVEFGWFFVRLTGNHTLDFSGYCRKEMNEWNYTMDNYCLLLFFGDMLLFGQLLLWGIRKCKKRVSLQRTKWFFLSTEVCIFFSFVWKSVFSFASCLWFGILRNVDFLSGGELLCWGSVEVLVVVIIEEVMLGQLLLSLLLFKLLLLLPQDLHQQLMYIFH